MYGHAEYPKPQQISTSRTFATGLPTFSLGECGEVERVGDGVPAVSVAGLDVEVVGGGRPQVTQRDLLVVQDVVDGLCAGGGHNHLLPGRGLLGARVQLVTTEQPR